MVPIKGEWTAFTDFQDQINHYRLWGLIPEKSKTLRPIMVTDGYFGVPQPCKVVGYQTEKWAVIELKDSYHAIHGDYLAELQPQAYQRIPRGLCFADILAKYTVIDIETTGFNFYNDSIIEIAAITYEYGKAAAQFRSLVNPGVPLPNNIVSLTGITQEEVNQAPPLGVIAQEFLDFIGDTPLVGHNISSFDVPFLSAQLGQLGNVIIDTLPISRKVFEYLPSHKLEYLKKILDLNNAVSHRALQDVETTNALLWACLAPRRYEAKVNHAYLFDHLSPLTDKSDINTKKVTSGPPKLNYESVNIKTIKPTCSSIDPTNPLYGKNVVFTGTLSISREKAMQIAVDSGAILKSVVSSKTHYLVVGQQDKAIVGDDGMSAKEEKAHQINQSGKAHIRIISETEFLDLVKKRGVLV